MAAAAPGTGAKDVRTFVTLHVNTIDQGEVVVVLRGDDVLIPIAALDQAGIHGLKGERETISGKEYVSLASLAPDVTFKLDTDALALDVSTAAKYLGKSAYSVLSNRPAGIQYPAGSSAYLNYALTGTNQGGSSAFFDAGINHDQNSFHVSYTAQEDEALRRGLIYYQMDNRDEEVRRVAGDLDASSGDLGGSSYMAGFGVSRDFSLDPYAIHFPLPSLSGVVTTPSVADVYINGQLVQRIDLPPGAFNLNQLPVTTGNGLAQVVVTNAFGQSQTYSQQYYATAEILAPGQTDFQYDVGLLRQNAFAEGDSYGPGVALAQYHAGITNWVTLGGRVEATPNLASAGPQVDFRTAFGSFHVAVAASDDRGYSGAAASAAYQYSSASINAGLSVLTQGPYYANVSQPAALDRPTYSLSAFTGIPIKGGSAISLQFSRFHTRDNGTQSQMSVGGSVPLFRRYSLALSLQRSTSTLTAPNFGLVGTMNFNVGRANVDVTTQVGTTKQNSIQFQDSTPSRYGLDYSASYNPGFGGFFSGDAAYQSQYGNAELDYSRGGGATSTEALRLAGAIGFIGGGAYVMPPVINSFALVDVPDTPGVGVYVENQYVGKTDSHGRLLVSDLLPYYANPIRIDDSNVPENTSIQTVEQLIAPPASAGAIVLFPAQRVHAFSGKVLVVMGGKTIVPAYGELQLQRGTFHNESALGENGEFYLENVPAGEFQAKVLFAKGECSFSFKSPSTNKPIVKMGLLECSVR
ncbi:MAG TPA: fimbria/pilus outer membrane usher protein [Candidatus Baltobacteraceae bacterium]|jgi:outer membrane usher protein